MFEHSSAAPECSLKELSPSPAPVTYHEHLLGRLWYVPAGSLASPVLADKFCLKQLCNQSVN